MQRLENGGVRIEYRDFDNNLYSYRDISKTDIANMNKDFDIIEIPNLDLKPSKNRMIESCLCNKANPNLFSIIRNSIFRGESTVEFYDNPSFGEIIEKKKHEVMQKKEYLKTHKPKIWPEISED